MFSLSESSRTPAIWVFIRHYFLSVVAPLIALEFLNGVIGFRYSFGSVGQTMMEYLLLSGVAFVLGIGAYLWYPMTAGTARKAWIFPLSLFVLSVCWDLCSLGWNWRNVVSSYIVFLPGASNTDEPWDDYWVFSFPVVAAVSYAIGNRVSEMHIFKPLATDVEP